MDTEIRWRQRLENLNKAFKHFESEGNDLVFSDLVSLNTKFEESEVPFDIDLLIRANITNQNLENQIAKHETEFYRKTAY
ncbi:MAG: hypothetical protein LBL62_04155 [Planctomycetaceae bacterium]|jgi:hypothetical protein|nr:hypothetical protein [Planctomycetaceae bacterium]